MQITLFAARITLTIVFAVAALTKLADLRGSRDAVAGFGVPERLAGPVGLLLPICELAVAVALLPATTARIGALGATLLLAMFAIAIARSMARGAAPECHCFGQLHSQPVGWRSLARNGALAAIALFVVLASGRHVGLSATAWIGRLSDAGVVALGACLALAALAAAGCTAWVALLRQNGRLLMRIDELEARLDAVGAPPPALAHPGLPLGEQAPTFTLSGLYGETITLSSLTAAGRPVMLLFTDPNCGPCNALMPEIAAWQREHAEDLTLAVLTRGTTDDNRAKIAEHGIANVCLDDRLAVYKAYAANGTPGAVLIDIDGRIASPIAAGPTPIAELVAAALDMGADGDLLVIDASAQRPTAQAPPAPQHPLGLAPGVDAPRLELRGLTGEPLELTTADRDTLIVFWNPSCGFCQRMLDDVRTFEREQPPGAPRLLLISSGSVEDNEAMELSSPIALDQAFAAGRAFRTNGTPSAVLVDSTGRIASGLAVGAPGVMALTGLTGWEQTRRLQER
jgi:thiol-disulfide isomerase/thioredoxin